jgi:hypothetical protein
MDSIVIRIRYLDLSAALDGTAVTAGRSTTVYLRPGLTAPQRSAALRRMRQEARVGRGPRLPCGQLAMALAADRVRSSAGRALAVVRLHPAIALLPSILLGATVGLLLMAAMSKGVPRHHHGPAAVSPALVARLIGGSVPLGPPRRLPPRRLLAPRLAAWRSRYGNIS